VPYVRTSCEYYRLWSQTLLSDQSMSSAISLSDVFNEKTQSACALPNVSGIPAVVGRGRGRLLPVPGARRSSCVLTDAHAWFFDWTFQRPLRGIQETFLLVKAAHGAALRFALEGEVWTAFGPIPLRRYRGRTCSRRHTTSSRHRRDNVVRGRRVGSDQTFV
jgi:hypothetical protein